MKKFLFVSLFFVFFACAPAFSASDDVIRNSIQVNAPEPQPAPTTYRVPVYYEVPVYYGIPNCSPIYCNGKQAPGYKRYMSKSACRKYYKKYRGCRR